MNNITKFGSYLILIVAATIGIFIIYILIINLIPISNPYMNFDGTSESYTIDGQYCNVIFNAKPLILRPQNNVTVFRSVKNISIDNWNGEIIFKNDSVVQINYKENRMTQNSIILQNINVKIFFDNVTINKGNNQILVEGYISKFYDRILKSNSNYKIIIPNNQVNSIYLGEEEFTDFKYISFEMDNTSYVSLRPGKIRLDGDEISQYSFNSQSLKYINLDKAEGILKLEDLFYTVENGKINVEINSIYQNLLNIDDSKMSLSGTVNSANLNENNIIKPKIFYRFDQEPEKINALAALILAFVTCIYVFLTIGMLKQSEASVKRTEKIIEQTKIGRKLDNIENLLMNVYSPMEAILTKFKLSLEYYKSKEPDGISSEFNNLFKKMNDELFEIKRNYGYLFDSELTKYHDNIWKLWEQYLGSEHDNKNKYESLNAEIIIFHDLISKKIDAEKKQKDKINDDFND